MIAVVEVALFRLAIEMKLATYNIHKGGRQRVHWTTLLETHGVNLLLVQESYPVDQHLPPLFYAASSGQAVWEMVEQNGWGSAVMSKDGSVVPISVPEFSGWVVGAEITGASWQANTVDPILAFSVHAPSRKEAYSKQVNKLLDEFRLIAVGREIVIGGDFNLAGSKSCGGELPVSKQDQAIQARLSEEFGLINCWETANPGQSPSQTLRWSGNRTIPYHCDGLFVPNSWRERLKSCMVMAGPEWDTLSDHNPVIAEFE